MINAKLLDNESYFDKLMIQTVIGGFTKTNIELNPESAKYINNCLVKEYVNEYKGETA
jgi:type I restriction enzyme R subunit